MWTSLGTPGQALADVCVAINGDGRLEAFVLADAQQIWHIWQVSAGGDWSGWNIFGSATDAGAALTVAHNADTRLELFRIEPAGRVSHSWQVPPNASWSAWTPMNNPEPAGRLVTIRNRDGRLELFLAPAATGASTWHARQVTPNGGWSDWSQLGDPLPASAEQLRGAGIMQAREFGEDIRREQVAARRQHLA